MQKKQQEKRKHHLTRATFIPRHSLTPLPELIGRQVRAGKALPAQGKGVAEAAVQIVKGSQRVSDQQGRR